MIKKVLLVLFIIIIVVAGIGWFSFKTSKTAFSGGSKLLLIYENAATKEAVLQALGKDSITSIGSFSMLAGYVGYWENIKPGRYRITQGSSVSDVVKQLKNGIQTPVDLVISRKIRVKEDFARLIGNNFECDSADVMKFLNNKDSLRHFGLDSASWITAIIENTYAIPWTWSPRKIFGKLYDEQQLFWKKENRLDLATQLGYSPEQVYTIASIVTEESNREDDREKIASVYMNRLAKGMKLQADPTVKFAMKNFMLKRILFVHLEYKSPYNTYINAGLPPGPICTVSGKTIDLVLNAPKTDYIFFVANADLRGGSSFSSTLEAHHKLAKVYQDSLTVFLQRKLVKEQAKKDSLLKALKL